MQVSEEAPPPSRTNRIANEIMHEDFLFSIITAARNFTNASTRRKDDMSTG